jgi:hypothetical protein
VTLQPGEYIVYANKNISTQVITDLLNLGMPTLDMNTHFYPNPLKTSSVVEYNLPESGKVTIRAYTAQGQDAGIIFSGYQQKGFQRIFIYKNTLINSPGVYLLSIQLNQKQKIQKFLTIN